MRTPADAPMVTDPSAGGRINLPPCRCRQIDCQECSSVGEPSAGPSSPSPAELAAEALRDFLGQDWCAGAETRLQALVRSVEERTLRQAQELAKDEEARMKASAARARMKHREAVESHRESDADTAGRIADAIGALGVR